ncbi:TIR domain-containing protein [Streptomyces sp. NPDC059459]|uniref:TIR domain-containing protein n=1 Tax=Streptomyces sp. NPDC059459 TaxID=3346839 RepID=UPI0036C9B075
MDQVGDRVHQHDVFISYSHQLDDGPATAFQAAVEHFGRPFYRSRDLRVFRDKTNLSASPHLWADIEKALGESAWLIVMASPRAAGSPWVRKEIRWWLEHRSSDRILIALTAGTIAWDAERGDFDWERTDCLPREEVAGAFTQEPRWVDLRWLREHKRISPRHTELVQAVAEFVAPVRERSKTELIGAHLRRQLRFRQTVTVISVVLAVLLGIAVVGVVRANEESDRAAERQLVATSRQLVAEAASIQDTQPDLARQLLVQAYRMAPTAQAHGALVASAAIPDVLPTDGSSHGVSYCPFGGLLASAADGGVTLYSTDGNRRLGLVGTEKGPATAVAFGEDCGVLAAGDAFGHVRLWSVSRADEPRLLSAARPDDGGVGGLAFIGRTLRLAVITDGAVPHVVDFEKRDAEVTDSLPGTTLSGITETIAVSPDGTLVAASYEGGKVRLMSLTDEGGLTVESTTNSPSDALAFSPDGQFLAAGGEENSTRLWDVSNPSRPRQAALLSARSSLGVASVAFSTIGRSLATGAGDGTIQLWDMSDPLRPAQGARLTGHSGTVRGLAFAPDGRTLASAASDGATRAADGSDDLNGTVRLWRVAEAERSSSRVFLPEGHMSGQPFGKDGHVLALGSPSTLWWVDGAARPYRLSTLTTFNQGGQQVSFGPDGRTLATGTPLKMWDASDPLSPRELTTTALSQGADIVLFSPDGGLVAADEDDRLGLWSTGDEPRRLALLPAAARSPAVFLDDGRSLAAVTRARDAVQVWDVSTPSEPRKAATLRTGAARPTSLAASEGTLYVGDSHGAVTAWRVRGDRAERLGSSNRHSTAVEDLAVHPGGGTAASGGTDGSVRIWDVSGPENLRESAVLDVGVGTDGMAFSPDGHTLAVSTGGATHLWEAEPSTIQQQLCAQSEPITRGQWAQYLPDRTYSPPCVEPKPTVETSA